MDEAKRSLSVFQQQMEALKARIGNLESDERSKENQLQELLQRLRVFKKTIEANVLSFTGKQIAIK